MGGGGGAVSWGERVARDSPSARQGRREGDDKEGDSTLSFTDPCNVRTASSICTLQSRVLLKSRRSLYKL